MGAGHEADQSQHPEQVADRSAFQHEGEALAEILRGVARMGGRAPGGEPHRGQAGQDRQIAQRVPQEAPALTHPSHQDAGQGRAHHPGSVDHRRVQADRVGQVLAAHHLDRERLARGDVEGVGDPQQDGQDVQMPDLDLLGQGEGGQQTGQQHGGRLGLEQDAAAVEAVGHQASQRDDQEDGNLRGKADHPQLHRRAGQAVDQPGLRHGLHPGADQRDHLPRGEKAEVPVAQGPEDSSGGFLGGLGHGAVFLGDSPEECQGFCIHSWGPATQDLGEAWRNALPIDKESV